MNLLTYILLIIAALIIVILVVLSVRESRKCPRERKGYSCQYYLNDGCEYCGRHIVNGKIKRK
jgi:hypothetical protein